MPPDRVLSQEEIDSVFRNLRDAAGGNPGRHAEPYDFRRPDRIAKDQLRAIHVLHENFARSLASSLSAYLRAYAMVNLVSVEQLSFMEFSQCLPSPSCIVSIGMKPFDGNALLEINPSLVFPILEMLLGGSGKTTFKVAREVTEIEQSILEGIFRIILNDLKSAWGQVASIHFAIDAFDTEPQLLQILAPNEAVVAISMEVRIGDSVGMMNLGIPSIIIKMLRQKFDQQWSVRKTQASEDDHQRVLRLIKPSQVRMDSRLQGPTLRIEDLLQIEEGQILAFDYPVEKQVDLLINGRVKHRGRIVSTGRKRAFHIEAPHDVSQ